VCDLETSRIGAPHTHTHTHTHTYIYIFVVVCCQVEISATSWSFVQRSRTDCGASLCVI